MYPSDLLDALVVGLRFNNVGSPTKVEVVHFRTFYDEGMDPIWMLIYDVEWPDVGLDARHERRMALGQGMRLHCDSIAEHMKGW